jgi:hypothetical protein
LQFNRGVHYPTSPHLLTKVPSSQGQPYETKDSQELALKTPVPVSLFTHEEGSHNEVLLTVKVGLPFWKKIFSSFTKFQNMPTWTTVYQNANSRNALNQASVWS